MTTFKLFFAPGACSRVSLNALEELGLPFEEHPLALMRGEHKQAGYLAINPKGKVPALLIGDRVLTENAAILFHLATQHPEGRLLPGLDDPVGRSQVLADLVWCGGTLHPLVRQMALPQLFTRGETGPVRDMALAAFEPVAAQIVDRVGGAGWWYGEAWSIVDVYLCWILGMARLGGAPAAASDAVTAYIDRVRSRPSFERALAREQAAVIRCDIPMPPGLSL